MARVLAVVTLALLAALVVSAAAKKSKKPYTDDQVDEINSRIAKCVQKVPAFSDFDRPGDTCRWEAITAVNERGTKKDKLTKIVVDCLRKRNVKADVVTTTEQCLKAALAKPV